ncbi:MAG: hypothetical protein U1E67_03360 [Hyphomicrobiales bacterium]
MPPKKDEQMSVTSQSLKIASAAALACLLSFGIADAAQKPKSGWPQDSATQQDCDDDQDCAPENGNTPPPKKSQYDNKNNKKKPQDNTWDNGDGSNNASQANNAWRYDPNKHKRNKYKDQRYKYYYGGYWYLEPYWTLPGFGYRLSCGEGREIVRDSGFYRVRMMDCEGRYYAYAGVRRGIPFRIVVSSRSGEIVSARPM